VSAELERDLGAWAAGSLSREGLLATYGADAAGTVALHERLVLMAAGIPIPDADAGWAALVSMIGTPAPVALLRRHARRRRTVSLLVEAALVVAGTAFAATRLRTHPAGAPSGAAPAPVVAPAAGPFFAPADRTLVPPPSMRAPTGGGNGSPGSSDGNGGSRDHHASVSGVDGDPPSPPETEA